MNRNNIISTLTNTAVLLRTLKLCELNISISGYAIYEISPTQPPNMVAIASNLADAQKWVNSHVPAHSFQIKEFIPTPPFFGEK